MPARRRPVPGAGGFVLAQAVGLLVLGQRGGVLHARHLFVAGLGGLVGGRDVALCGQGLPIVFGQRLHLVFQQGGVRRDFRTFGQVERRHQPVVQYLGGVCHLGQLQLQRFPLQLVAGDVVLQDRSFAAACLHVGYHLLRQFQVLLQHLQLVVQLVEVQVVARKQEADFLPVLLPVQLGQLLFQLGQADTAADGPAGVDHLLRLDGKVVSEVRHVDARSVVEVAVPQPSVAQVAGRC